MSNTKLFAKKFSKSNLKMTYDSYIYFSYAIGVDNISHDKFNINLINEIDIINKKIKNKTYKFSPYKLKLLNKGKGKVPREIYIPTIRDRIVLKNIQLFLSEVFNDQAHQDIPQNIIHKLKVELNSKKYDSYIKIDIQ
ncbi:MAG: reverse transcriptase, partial [Pseudomonas sp.]